MFAASGIDDNNIVAYNFLFEFWLKVLGCDSATDRLLGQVSHVGFSYQFVRRNPVYPYPVLDEVIGEAYVAEDRKSTRLNSSHGYISYAVFCLKKKKQTYRH